MSNSIISYRGKMRKYYEYYLPSDLNVIKWLSIIGIALLLLAIYIDYSRVLVNSTFVYEIRAFQLITLALMGVIGIYKNSSVPIYQWTLYTVSTIFFVTPVIMDYSSSMPPFFLPNCIIMYLFAFNLLAGHPFVFKTLQTIAVIFGFYFYAQHLSPHPDFHLENLFNIINNSGLILAASWLTRNYRLSNFSQKLALDESNVKIESNSHLKTKMLSMISHDFASPVRNLSSLIFLRKNKHISEEELTENFEKIQTALEGITTQMEGMFSWTKMQLDGFNSIPKHFEVNKLMTDVIKSFDFQIKKKNIIISNELPTNLEIHSHFEVLQMVLRNLLSNAIKYSPQAGKISIHSKISGDSIAISVKDNGTGMTKNQIANLFKLNIKSTPGTEDEKGSGIGLAITNDFVELVGGSIKAQSVEMQGSEFIVTMPIIAN